MSLLVPESTLFEVLVAFIIQMRFILTFNGAPCAFTFGWGPVRVLIYGMLEFVHGYAVRHEQQR
ncbi:hypothetical protein D3C73_1622600 [compost metagenome]